MPERTNAQIILETVSWLEANLQEDLSIPEMAAKSGYSLHHFTRLFHGITGLPPREYFEKRKLSEAARRIAAAGKGNRSVITEIALDFGYNDLETFTRAFSRVMGAAPSAVRRGAPFAYHPPAVNLRDGTSVRFTIREQPRIETVAQVIVVGWSVRIWEETSAVGALWKRFRARAGTIPGLARPIRFTQISSLPDGDSEEEVVEIMVGAELEELMPMPVDLSMKTVPESLCLVFTHRGPVTRIPESYRYIYAEWLPASSHRPGLPFSRERYLPNAGDPMSEDHRFEILVPIVE